MRTITWSELQKEKRTKEKKKMRKEIYLVILVSVVFILAMIVAGGTFPY